MQLVLERPGRHSASAQAQRLPYPDNLKVALVAVIIAGHGPSLPPTIWLAA